MMTSTVPVIELDLSSPVLFELLEDQGELAVSLPPSLAHLEISCVVLPLV
jgi:hypothetical protein